MKGLQGRDWSFWVPPDSSKWSPVRKLPWAMVSRGFIGVSSCRQDWLLASSSALLSPEVGLTQRSNPLTTMRLVFLETSPTLKLNYLGPPCSPYLPISPHPHTSVYSYLTSNNQPVFLCPMAFSPRRWLCSSGSRQEVTGFTPLGDAHTNREAKRFAGISHIEWIEDWGYEPRESESTVLLPTCYTGSLV